MTNLTFPSSDLIQQINTSGNLPILNWYSILISKLADPSEDDDTMIPPFLGYAKPGSARGKLLYVNYGRTEDFDVIKKNFSIANCKEHIVIMRYGSIFRGDMVCMFIVG